MANIYGPILPLQLDSRNTEALVRAIQSRIYLESNGTLTDFTPASPLSAISEGQAFAQSELLYYLNLLPEAFSLYWFRQLGIQRKLGSRALVDVTFYKVPGYQRALVIPKGTKLLANGSQEFVTLSEVRISESEFSATVPCQSEKWGSAYNVSAGAINKVTRNFAGLESLNNLEAAVGGTDVETISQMKARAFEVLSRRNLTTADDFANEVRTLVPDTSIVKVLTYEERNQISSLFSGNIVICVGDENGREIGESSLGLLVDSMRPRVTLGTNISFIPPDIIPIDLSIEIYYDPNTTATSTEFLANQVFEVVSSYFDPTYLELGETLSYQDVAKLLYQLDFVKSINSFQAKLMIKDATNIEGYCAGFSGEEDEDNEKCSYRYLSVVDKDSQTQVAYSPISSYKLYRAEIGLTSVNDFSALTFTYDNLYTT
jgi:hypothetical protein